MWEVVKLNKLIENSLASSPMRGICDVLVKLVMLYQSTDTCLSRVQIIQDMKLKKTKRDFKLITWYVTLIKKSSYLEGWSHTKRIKLSSNFDLNNEVDTAYLMLQSLHAFTCAFLYEERLLPGYQRTYLSQTLLIYPITAYLT